MTDLELYEKITSAGLTPNQYFAVLFHLLGVTKKTNFNQSVTISQLQREGFLTKDKRPTKRLVETKLFEDLELRLVEDDTDEKLIDKQVETFISFFPHGRLPSGAFARANTGAVKLKFKDFFQQYDYSWDTIFEATENYVNHYAQDGYKWMRSCLNFIIKDSTGESQLALECEAVKGNKQTSNTFSFGLDI